VLVSLLHRLCGAEIPCREARGGRAAPPYQAPIGWSLTPYGDWLVLLQTCRAGQLPTPSWCPSGLLLGGRFPATTCTGATLPQCTGSHPVRRLNTGLAARGAEGPPYGYHTVRPETLPVHGAREEAVSSWLRLVRFGLAGTASGARVANTRSMPADIPCRHALPSIRIPPVRASHRWTGGQTGSCVLAGGLGGACSDKCRPPGEAPPAAGRPRHSSGTSVLRDVGLFIPHFQVGDE
jgi:hypothetical protein